MRVLAAQGLREQHARTGKVVAYRAPARHLQHGIGSGKDFPDHTVTHLLFLLMPVRRPVFPASRSVVPVRP